MELKSSKTKPPIGAIITANLVNKNKSLNVKWEAETELAIEDGLVLASSASIARYLAKRSAPALYGGDDIQRKTEVDHWLSFTLGPLAHHGEFRNALTYLDSVLAPITFLVGQDITIADYVLFGALYASPYWHGFMADTGGSKEFKNILRWYKYIGSKPEVKSVIGGLPKDVQVKPAAYVVDIKKEAGATAPRKGDNQPKQTKDEGKFVDLPGAEMGKVVVRFPPEASGYLHVGHAKAALLNQHYQQSFQGKLIMRFDDTNPAKEKEEFEDVILEDLKMLRVKYDHFSRTSDHFEVILGYAEKLIKDGKAYVDDTDAETMKAEREARTESKNRNNSVDKNLKLWNEMKAATDAGMKCALRAKINMASDNGCLRDPTIYRCKPEKHPATGDKFKVYPTYDFACPIVDSIEGVTHSLRTTEYMDRDDQFNWFIDALGLRKPHIWAYARLNLTNTVMSKRKLTFLVDEGWVEGWDDPRLPTVRGVLRRGLTVDALKMFIVAQGSSRSVVFMEWDKIWAMNKKVIDPVAPRFTTVEKAKHVEVHVKGVQVESVQADKHPKDPAVGKKTVWRGPTVIIDSLDAEALKEGENTTFINWGNLIIDKINRSADGSVTSVEATPNLDNKDFKKTLKVTWLAKVDGEAGAAFTPATCVYYDHIISKPVLDKNDDFKSFVAKDTRTDVEMLGDPELRTLKKGDIIQIQRRGFFIVDSPYQPLSPNTCRPSPIRLISIPDGSPDSYGPPGKKAAAPAAAATPAKASGKDKKEKKSAAPAAATPTPVPATATPGWSTKAVQLNGDIAAQGEKVRKLKADKADKDAIKTAVDVLLSLKAKFKSETGLDWKPGMTPPTPAAAPSAASSGSDADALNDQLTSQGDKVRTLKTAKADKAEIESAVTILLDLKAKYKAATGKDWKAGAHQKSASPAPSTTSTTSSGGSSDADALNDLLTEQGDKVRALKTAKVDKSEIESAVKILLDLKAKYKAATGKDWKAGAHQKSASPAPAPVQAQAANAGGDLEAQIKEQGDKVRTLKGNKADKAEIEAAVKILLDLKAKYKAATGKDWNPNSGGSGKKDKKKDDKQQQKQQSGGGGNKKSAQAAGGEKGMTRLGMEAKKEESLADWYSQIIVKAEMLEYYDVSGCYILRPWAYSIWERIQSFFDGEIKKLGVQNCYFPIFVSQAALQREKDHIADFAPEVAWVTKSGESDLAEPIAIRPTSETVMYPAYAKWIQSYRDLPIKLNQWNNVVVSETDSKTVFPSFTTILTYQRWEFKHPQPFLRTREFLWQEGHTAFATFKEAKEEVLTILDLYRQIYEDLLAIPVVRGKKTEKEKFAGKFIF